MKRALSLILALGCGACGTSVESRAELAVQMEPVPDVVESLNGRDWFVAQSAEYLSRPGSWALVEIRVLRGNAEILNEAIPNFG